jgi:predicted RNase H-like HicB family nuclease
MKKIHFTAAFVPEEDGGFMAIVEELPGAISYGDTLEEARENIQEAIELILETNREKTEEELELKFPSNISIQREIVNFK